MIYLRMQFKESLLIKSIISKLLDYCKGESDDQKILISKKEIYIDRNTKHLKKESVLIPVY